MAGAPVPSDKRHWELWLSAGLHLLAIILLLSLPSVAPLAAPPADNVAVEVLTPQQFIAATKPVAATELAAPEPAPATPPPARPEEQKQPSPLPQPSPAQQTAPVAPPPPPPPPQPETIRATRFFSQEILDNPRSRGAKAALKQLEPEERMTQLCNIEAMEQVHIWKAVFQPDFVVAYAMADVKRQGLTIKAEGAAFRSRNRWYNIAFTCQVTSDLADVVAFEFRAGDEIPQEEWENHALFADDGNSD